MHRSCRYRLTLLAAALLPGVAAAAPVPLGGETQVATQTTGHQSLPVVAFDGAGNFVVAWQGPGPQNPSSTSIWARRYGADGAALDATELLVSRPTAAGQTDPVVAREADGDFAVAWTNAGYESGNAGVFARRFAADGTPLAQPFRVNRHTTGLQNQPALATDEDGDFVVAWVDHSGQDGDQVGVFARRFGSDGAALDALDLRVNTTGTGRQDAPAAAMNADGAFVLAWTGLNQPGALYGLYARRYAAGGAALDAAEVLVPADNTLRRDTPRVAIDLAGNYAIGWAQGRFRHRRFGADGTVLDAADRFSSVATCNQPHHDLAMQADGGFAAAWVCTDASGQGVFLRRFAADGSALDAADVAANTTTASHQNQPAIALDGSGRFAVAWTSNLQDGAGQGVYLQRFEPENHPPVARDDRRGTDEDAAPQQFNVTGNDADPDGDALAVTAVTGALHGSAAPGSTPGRVRYAPDPDFAGIEHLAYTVDDGRGGTAQAELTIAVANANEDPPQARADRLEVAGDAGFTDLPVLANDHDPDPATVLRVVRIAQAPAHGSARVAGGVLQYRPHFGYRGSDTLRYVVSDGALTDSGRVTVEVGP